MKDTRKSLTDVNQKVKTASSSFKNMFKGIAVAGVVTAIGKISIASVKLAANLEQTRITLQTLTGSNAVGDGLLKSIKELANVTPFTSSALLGASKSLLAFDFSANQIVPTLGKLGDVAAGTGKDIKELAIIFGKIKSAGKLQGQELNQLIDAGFNPLNDIAKKTGKTMSELKDEMRKGNITFKQVDEAFISATEKGGKFYNLMNAQSNSFSGRLSTLKDSLEQIEESLGGIAVGVLKPIVAQLQKAADALKNVLEGKGTKFEIAIVGTTAVTAMIVAMGVLTASVLYLASKMRAGLKSLPMDTRVNAISTAGTRSGTKMNIDQALKALKNDKTLIIHATKLSRTQTIIARATTFLAKFYNKLKFLSRAFGPIGLAIAAVVGSVVVWVNGIKSLNEAVGGGITLWDSFKGGIKNLIDIIPFATEAVGIWVKGWEMQTSAIESIAKGLEPAIEGIKSGWKSFYSWMGDTLNTFSRNVVNTFTGGKFGELLDRGFELEGPNQELIKRRAKQKKEQAEAQAAKPTAFDIALDLQIADDLMDIGLAFEKTLRDMKDVVQINPLNLDSLEMDMSVELDNMVEGVNKDIAKSLQKIKTEGRIRDFLGGAGGLFGGLIENAEGLANKFGFNIPKPVEKDHRLSGAFAKGSVEANRILTQRDEEKVEKKIEDNTKLTAKFLKQLLDGGVNINNVAVAN